MIAPGRIPCVNPRCRRTGAADKFPGSTSIICGKCLRALPASLRRRFKAFWARERKLNRLHRRKDCLGRPSQWARVNALHSRSGSRVWWAIDDFFRPVEKPAGLDSFLEDMGLA